MKKILFLISIVFVVFLLNSCFYLVEPGEDWEKYDSNQIPRFETIDDAANWVSNFIKYKKDIEDYWQFPLETLAKGTGDCDDYCGLFLSILYTQFDITDDAIMVLSQLKRKAVLDNDGNVIIPERTEYHVFVDYQNIIYDLTSGLNPNWDRIIYFYNYSYTYGNYIWISKNWGADNIGERIKFGIE